MFHRHRLARQSLQFVLVAIASALGASAGSTRLPVRFVPGDQPVGPVAKDQVSPFLSQGGTTVLAVWSDNRANTTGAYEGETSKDVYGMRLDGAGTPLEAVPFAVVAGRASQENPRAAWNGTNWLVVYESYDLSGTGYYYQKSLEAVRVAPDGRVLDSKPTKIFNVTPVGATWAVASDGANWVIAIQGTSASTDLVAVRISPLGAVLDPGPRKLVPGTYYLRGGFHLAYAGGVFLLAYEESMTGSDPTSAIRFDSDLDLLDAAPHTLAGAPLSRLVSNGSGFYAVWNQQQPDYSIAVMGSRIGTNGQKLDGNGLNISGSNPPQPYTTTGLAWDGGNWKVSWGGPTGTRLARVGASGQLLDPGGVLVGGAHTGLTASSGNGSVQLVWSDFLASNDDVYTGHVSASNAAGPIRPLSVGAPAQLRVDVATSGSGYMMVYRSSTASRNRVLAQPLDAVGNPLTAEPIELDAADSPDRPGFPAVAWNGSVYLAAWNNASGVVARRLQPGGNPIDPSPFVVLNPGFGPADVEALGNDFLVVGLRCGINCQYVFPIAARVRGSDGLVRDVSPIVMGGTFCSSPRLAVLGGRWLLAWTANVTHDNPTASTLGTFIDAAGVKVPDFNIHGPFSTAGGNGIFSLGLASSGSVALLVQSQELTSGFETDVLGRLIDSSGAVQPSVNLTPWEGDQYHPRAAWDGSQFVVVWQDQRMGLGEWGLEPLDARSDLIGMRISPAGVIVDPQGFVVSNSPIGEAYPNVVASGGQTLIAGSVLRNEAALANYRIGYELFGAGGNRWPVARATATPSGGDVPITIDFSSAGSSDPDGAVAAYAWDFGDGASSASARPSHQYAVGGPYVATLTVTDDRGAQSLQQVLVKAVEPNQRPVALASADRNSGPSPLDVVFSAAGSYDLDGFLGNIEWTFSDGDTYWGSPAYHTFEQPGTHQVTLTVHDARGGTGTDTLTVTAGPPLPPAAPSGLVATAFTSDWINMTWVDHANNEAGFEVERCPGTPAFCAAHPASWTRVVQTGANIDYYADTGLAWGTTFSYRVRAFNATAGSAYSNTSSATTLPPPPVAEIVPSVLNGPAPLAVQFDGRGSHDPDGAIVDWSWSFGDGGGASGALANHTYLAAGDYLATLYVTSSDGAQASAAVWIAVTSGNASNRSGEAAGNGVMLRLSKASAGALQLDWGASCMASDSDYGVYEGPLGNFTAHVPVLCSTGGATTATLAPSAGSSYYLVVPNNHAQEGRYGQSSSGVAIPSGPTRCYPAAATSGCP
ncbi:MAG TPA: PKD domain-containing protein [Candidatus Polarisedimenticolaceae bacterium]|nr:PKD domain-containing protein [Candidatus Polarisedimenticolaceae bacterium]